MENVEELTIVDTIEDTTPSCANCGSKQLAINSKTPLCQPCRERYIKYPVPLWIKAFGGALLVILVFCLFNLSKNIQTGILYRKGKLAVEKHQYQTAAKTFRTVLEKEPHYIDAQCRLLIAAFYNHDLATVFAMYTLLDNKEIEDQKLFGELNQILSKTEKYLPNDSFNHFVELSGLQADSIPPTDYYTYLAAHPEDDYVKLQLARILLDRNSHLGADSLLNQLLRFDPYNIAALSLKVPVKRELEQLDSSMQYVKRLLDINQEYTYAHGAMVRNLLWQKKDKEALQLAKQLSVTYGNDGYILSSLALAYHFNSDPKQCDLMLHEVAKDSTMAPTVAYIKDIISGKEKFRTN
jgi:tetratricopeptide (TPR) repeat protein